MTNLLAQVLPVALGGAISPTPTIICILLLISRRPLTNATAFLAGNSLVLVAIGILALALLAGNPFRATGPPRSGIPLTPCSGSCFWSSLSRVT